MLNKIGLFIALIIIPLLAWAQNTRHLSPFPLGADQVTIHTSDPYQAGLLLKIAPVIKNSISTGYYPGAVILASHQGKILYEGVFGNQRIKPAVAPMKLNTIFDLASLTKVIATTPAILQLVDENQLELDTPVAHYWKKFGNKGKESITVRMLLTHTSGLPTTLPTQRKVMEKLGLPYPWPSKKAILNYIEQLEVIDIPGTQVKYGDINFVVLAHLLEIVTGQRFDQYSYQNIFKPLQMNNTFFFPTPYQKLQIAPTEEVDNQLRWGQVHDPLAFALGGISGNAGLFSNVVDLGKFAEAVLQDHLPARQNLASHKIYISKPLMNLMKTPQTPFKQFSSRTLGWEFKSISKSKNPSLSTYKLSHTGWTGTAVWIDQETQTWLVFLTSRTHPLPTLHNQLIEDRQKVASLVFDSVHPIKGD